jgi:type II secretory pathway pseudopilin PulG
MKPCYKPGHKTCCLGFTLVEALVAAVILIIGISGALGAISAGVRAQSAADFYSTTASLAQQKMAELECRSDLSVGEESGTFEAPYEAYKWSYVIEETPQDGPQGLWYVKLTIAKTNEPGFTRQAEIVTYLLRREP